KAFSSDSKILEIVKQAVKQGFDKQLSDTERAFFYLPFEHSEDIKDQQRSVELFAQLGTETIWYDYAVQHLEIIEEFGRFPHRNEALGRESSEAEKAYLAKPDAGF